MIKLTPEDTMTTLECHIKRRCYMCPVGKEEIAQLNQPCGTIIAENALALIREKDEMIEALRWTNKQLLKVEKEKRRALWKRCRNETINEFVKVAHERPWLDGSVLVVAVESIDQVAEEMKEERK